MADKRLEDYMREHRFLSGKEFDRMTYRERLKLFNENPQEYSRLAKRGSSGTTRTSGATYTSQIVRGEGHD